MSETPTVADVFRAISYLKGHSTARALCEHLVRDGYSRAGAQLSIQRACDSGGILGIQRDWTLRLKAPSHIDTFEGAKPTEKEVEPTENL